MAGEVALSSSIRANLTSLQSTNKLLDRTQLRLASGRDVNSVFDDPVNFVAAQRLSDRASDLERILDGISQSLRTVEQANTGSEALITLLEQGQSIVESASTAISSSTAASAIMTGNVDLSEVDDIPNDLAAATATSEIRFNLIDNTTGTNPVTTGVVGAGQVSGVISIGAGDSIQQVVAAINDLNDTLIQAGAIQDPIIEARLDNQGQLIFQSLLNDSTLNVQFVAASGVENDGADIAFATDLGFGGLVETIAEDGTNGQNDIAVTLTTDAILQTVPLYTDTDGIGAGAATTRAARASDQIDQLLISATSAAGNAVVTNAGDIAIRVGINGTFATNFAVGATTTLQEFIDAVNNDAALSGLARFEFDDTTSQLSVRTLDAAVETVQIGLITTPVGSASELRLGLGQNTSLSTTANANDQAVENIRFGSAAGELLALEGQFNDLRVQIDQLITDSDFRGVNILNGDDLVTYFNEDRTSSLTTTSVTFTSTALNLIQANFGSIQSINRFITDVRNAQTTVRSFSAGLTNDLNVIATRETFTQRTVSTLRDGSDDLTLANEETEGARMLALQTRQQLGITSLSLASQAQQGILRLF